MNIRRERFGDFLRFHQRKRQTVGQSPFLVGSGEINLEPRVKQALRERFDLITLLSPQSLEETLRFTASADASVAIADFQQDSPMQHQYRVLVEHFAIQIFRSLMVRIAAV